MFKCFTLGFRVAPRILLGLLLVFPLAWEHTTNVVNQQSNGASRSNDVVSRLPLEWREVTSGYIESHKDTVAQLAELSGGELLGTLLYFFAQDPKTQDFVLDHLTDPLPRIWRLRVISYISEGPLTQWVENGRVDSVFKKIALSDPDYELAMTALDSARQVEIHRLRNVLDMRLQARERSGTANEINMLAEEDERWMTLERGAMLPSFLRRTPPVFTARATGSAIRVLAFGDFGSGDENQRANAGAMQSYAHLHPFDFGITLGDNFYDKGATGLDDPRWTTLWTNLYGSLGITFYPVLGNHDWYDPDSPAAELLYSTVSSSWHMPSLYYSFKAGAAQFFALDTNDFSAAQIKWLTGELKKSSARWRIVYGHHPPYFAVRPPRDQDPRIVSALMPILAGQADVYIAGHAHNLEHLRPVQGVNLFVAGGGGALTYGVEPDSPNALFAKEVFGFAVLEIEDNSITVRFVDKNGNQLYQTTITKK
jgi:tartrate-resistant acid phosphatase type 5